VDAVLLESEPGSPDDRVNALTEFVIQYVEQREQPGGFKGIPGERYTQWLEFIEGDGDEVDTVAEWLSRDPDTRQVPSVLDNTAVDLATELGLTWRRASFLIEWDEDVAGQWVGIYFDSIGVVGPWYLEPADAAVIVDGIVPLDRLGTVFVWPFEVVRAAPDSDALVTERVAMGQVDPLTGGDPALWISIRLSNGVGSVIEPLSRAEFRELSDSIDFAREAATPGG
jgi:hypothetical protein